MAVRVKMKVDSITLTPNGGAIELSPVTEGSPESQAFFKWTPWGCMKIGTVNQDALEQFAPGDQFYIDLTKAEG